MIPYNVKIEKIIDNWITRKLYAKRVQKDGNGWVDSIDLECNGCGKTKYMLKEKLYMKLKPNLMVKTAFCEDCKKGKVKIK